MFPLAISDEAPEMVQIGHFSWAIWVAEQSVGPLRGRLVRVCSLQQRASTARLRSSEAEALLWRSGALPVRKRLRVIRLRSPLVPLAPFDSRHPKTTSDRSSPSAQRLKRELGCASRATPITRSEFLRLFRSIRKRRTKFSSFRRRPVRGKASLCALGKRR